jgi:hypothetical protein
MAKSETDWHEGRVTVWKVSIARAWQPGFLAKLLDFVVGMDLASVFRWKLYNLVSRSLKKRR